MPAEVKNFGQFRLEEVAEPTPEPSRADRAVQSAAVATLLLALKTLSQKALLAFVQLFTLITVGSCFWLWMSIPEPSTNQLISLGMYAGFVFAINWITLRRRGA